MFGIRTARLAGGALMASGAALAYLGWRALGESGYRLDGRVVLITGGSRGLGLLMSREFVRQGARRVVICARDERELDAARRDLESRGAEVLAQRCDVGREDEVRELIAAAISRFGGIDIVVNNAGIIQVGPLETQTLQDFRDAMDAIFWGTVHTTLAALPHMLERGTGRIVNITSIGGKVAVPHLLPYDCAKFATVGFSEGLRSELGKYGVKVTTVVPGLMRTGSPVNALFKGKQELEFSWFSMGSATPLTAMSARRAARRIVRAARRGEAELTLTWQAKLLRLAHDLAPGVTVEALGLVDRLLPGPDGRGAEMARGLELATPVSPSPLTSLMNAAARETHQYDVSASPSDEHRRKAGLDD